MFYPLLHYPTFSKLFNEGLHHQDAQFAAVVWCVIAVGARWSEDRRVLWDGWGSGGNKATHPGDNNEMDWASAGWRFYLRGLGTFGKRVKIFDQLIIRSSIYRRAFVRRSRPLSRLLCTTCRVVLWVHLKKNPLSLYSSMKSIVGVHFSYVDRLCTLRDGYLSASV